MRRIRSTALAVTCLLAAGALTGCSPGADGPTSAPATPTVEASPFPRAVPLVAGRVVTRSFDQGEWRVWIAVKDPLTGYRSAQAKLIAAGFILTKDRQNTTGGDGQACTDVLCVDITGVDDPTYGDTVAYVVFAPSGVGPA